MYATETCVKKTQSFEISLFHFNFYIFFYTYDIGECLEKVGIVSCSKHNEQRVFRSSKQVLN